MGMIWIVTMGAENTASRFRFAFSNFIEAEKFRKYLDRNKGTSLMPSIITAMELYDNADKLMDKTPGNNKFCSRSQY